MRHSGVCSRAIGSKVRGTPGGAARHRHHSLFYVPPDAGQSPGGLHQSNLYHRTAADLDDGVRPGQAARHAILSSISANLVHGNLGESFFYKRPVAEVLGELLPNTLMLSLVFPGPGLYLWHRCRRYPGLAPRHADGNCGIIYTLVSRSAPEFWVGMLLLTLFAFKLQWLPASGATSPGVIYR